MSALFESDRTVPALVFKIGRYPVHHGTLGIVRSLGRLRVPVYAVVEDRFTPVAGSRYLSGAFVWDTTGLEAARLLAGLAVIRERLRRPAILIPTDDLAAAFIAEHADTLDKWFLFPRMVPDLPRRLANKKDLYFLCRQIGVPCPETIFPCSLHQVHEFIRHTAFPVIVKAAEPHRLPKGIRGTSIARTPAELLAIYRRAESPEEPNLMFQQYIPDECAEDWITHGYSNPSTACLLTFTGRKLRSFPVFAGITTLGVSRPNQPLRLQSEKLVKALGYAGVMDLDYRLDKRDGLYKLLDFNPRIGANFRMFEDRAGVDVVRALYLDLTGGKVARLPAVARTFLVESYDLFTIPAYLRRGGLTVMACLKSFQGPRELAWLDWTDPLPFFLMWARLFSQTAGRVVQRWRARLAVRRRTPTVALAATGNGNLPVDTPQTLASFPNAGDHQDE